MSVKCIYKLLNSLALTFSFLALNVQAQIVCSSYNNHKIDSGLCRLGYKQHWKAEWITHPEHSEYGVYHFQKTIKLDSIPEKCLIHVSADNRYKLYVNEKFIGLGPVRSDVHNWYFDTYDLSSYLTEGDNVIHAIVWYFGDKMAVAQHSQGSMGFILQPDNDSFPIHTDASWRCVKNNAYSLLGKGNVSGYFVAGPCERVDYHYYPSMKDDDDCWLAAKNVIGGAIKGSCDYKGRWLVPSPIPPMEMENIQFQKVRLTENCIIPETFLTSMNAVIIPSNTHAKILLDQNTLTTGYLNLSFSKGNNAVISIGYAESLYHTEGKKPYKGNRNQVDGKTFLGYYDRLVSDGRENCLFTSLWWRTWRYVQLEIKTENEPLILNGIYGTFTAYPFERLSHFQSDSSKGLNEMLEIGWRTARLCANETYMDCPYYEQLQYWGDTRIQTMITLYNTDDTYMVKHAIEAGRKSMTAEGITQSRYPSHTPQYIPPYSLSWIGIVYDYWMMRGDNEYVRTLLSPIRSIMAWYEQYLKPDGALGYIPFWYFTDWTKGFPHGEAIRDPQGDSSIQDLNFLMALREAEALERSLGVEGMADHYAQLANSICKQFNERYWDNNRKMYSDTKEKRNYSQHANTLAILSGIVTGDEAQELLKRILVDQSISQASIYYRYYLQQAMDKVGLGDMLLDNINIQEEQMKLGLTTWAEQPEPSRSDCHAWGSNLNIELYRMILGIRSGAPGFKHVVIKPSLNNLKYVEGFIPHPHGKIAVSYQLNKKQEATIELPQGVTGEFCWKGKSIHLNSGKNIIKL